MCVFSWRNIHYEVQCAHAHLAHMSCGKNERMSSTTTPPFICMEFEEYTVQMLSNNIALVIMAGQMSIIAFVF